MVTPEGFDPVVGFPTIEQLDSMPPEDFAVAVAPLFEGAPQFLKRLAGARPFGSEERLFQAARQIAHDMPEAEQIELIDAHPRIGAPPASVSAISYREQGYDREAAGSAPVTPGADPTSVAAELARLNDAYEDQFGFRCCIFVAGRPRAEVLPEMRAVLAGDRRSELHRNLDAVVDIARDRWRKLAAPGAREAATPDAD